MEFLNGQIVVITGASSGIGKAIALGLAGQGASLCLVGRKLEILEEVAQRARSTAQCARSYQVELMLEKDIVELAVHLQQDFGHVDILIHSAGVISQGRFKGAPVEDFDWQYRVTSVPHMP
jgi:NADP-dependent 3-hydroxy acid dehydrogenase YdfG